MENPPPNYNPNESLLSGGIENITKVMGGGGGGAPPGYNETTSLLDGGIEPIVKVEGGAIGDDTRDPSPGSQATPDPSPGSQSSPGSQTSHNIFSPDEIEKSIEKHETNEINVRYVTKYEIEKSDADLFNKFLAKIANITDVNKKLQNEINTKERKIPLYEYIKRNNDYDTTIPPDTSKYVKIKFIPPSNEIIVLPPTPDVNTFFKLLYFLLDNKYISIKSNQEIIIKRNTIIVHLIDISLLDIVVPVVTNPVVGNPLVPQKGGGAGILYFYLKLKNSNMNKYFVPDYPYKIIFSGEKPLLFSYELKKPESTHLEPIMHDIIAKKYIKQMTYKPSQNAYDSEFIKIHKGSPDVDNTITTIPNPLVLDKYIAIIQVKASDANTITVEINGMNYRIRIPDGKYDSVYSSWENGKYKYDEVNLINDLHAAFLSRDRIAKFLFELTYFKCFNDLTLLTKQECVSMRETLQELYTEILKDNAANDEAEPEIEEKLGADETIEMIDIMHNKCKSYDAIAKKMKCNYYDEKTGITKEIDVPYNVAIHESDPASIKLIDELIKDTGKQMN